MTHPSSQRVQGEISTSGTEGAPASGTAESIDKFSRTRLSGYFDVYPFNSAWVRGSVRSGIKRWWLPIWFALNSTLLLEYYISTPGSFGFDIRLYRMAADAWLAGQNPWTPTLAFDRFHMVTYAGPPPTLLPSLMLAWIPIDVVVLLFTLLSGGAAMWTIHQLKLPVWWILFPPIFSGIWVGNLNIIVIALLVSGSSLGGGIATVFKIYAAVPLLILGRWKALVAAGAILVLTLPFLPWAAFLTEYPRISALLTGQAWGGETSVLTSPLATVGAAIGILLLGRNRAAWLAVPTLWPATQLHYTVLALPVLSPVLAAFATYTHPGFLGLGVMLCALWSRRDAVANMSPRRARSVHRVADDRPPP